MDKTRRTSGFTLIEVLVTIAILGFLATVVLMSGGESRAKARDVERKNNITQLSLALRAYAEQFDEYPNANDGTCSHNTSFSVSGCMQVLVSEGFINELPSDTMSGFSYYYDNCCNGGCTNSGQYRLWIESETDQNGLDFNWWDDTTLGATTCDDPS